MVSEGVIKRSNDFCEEYRQPPTNEFINKDATYTIIEYTGDIASAVNAIPNAKVFIVDEFRAILSFIGDLNEIVNKLSNVIVYVNPSGLYTLCDISPLEASSADIFYNNPYLQLDGSGVIVGIIDSGIDYLNEEFINEDGTSRILAIFDQTIEGGKRPSGQPIGSEYSKEDIDKAIDAKKNGKDPYDLVPSRDEIGHGTNMAGILGARGANPQTRGVAPRCTLAVVKLILSDQKLRDDFGVYGNAPTFSTVAVFLAMRYLFSLASTLKSPIVIFIPLGTNTGPRNGLSFIEKYIDEVSRINGVVCVVPIGNQGNADNHTSGVIANKGDIANIELRIDKNQKNIKFEIWASKPDKLSLSMVSPTGEIIDRIPPKSNQTIEVKFLYEETKMYIQYFIPEEATGDERIIINARDIKEGIWIFKLEGDLVVVGKYDCYLIQRELLAPTTKFLSPIPYTTLTVPSSSMAAISVAEYNQNNNSNVAESGRGYTRDGRVKPEIAAGGINALTTAVGGGTQVVSGTSVAAAVIAGCSALIYQWGIILGNDKTLYSSKVKTYLIRGTSKLEGEKYPNPQWGYGVVNMKGVFDNIRLLLVDKSNRQDECFSNNQEIVKEYNIGNLFIRIPI